MRMIILLLCGLLVFSACREKPKADAPIVTASTQYSQSRYLLSPVYLSTKIDSLNKKPITYYLGHPEMDSVVLKIYYGELVPKQAHLHYLYDVELNSSPELSPFFSHLSNYISEATQVEGDSIQKEKEKIRREELLKKVEIESVDGRPISFYLNHPDLHNLIKDFYAVKFLPSDNDKTFHLLELLTNKHPDLYPFYFHCLNQICVYSDGALSEVMGEYCMQAVLNYPHYFFTKNKDYISKYAGFMRYELYFAKNETTPINNDYKEFMKRIKLELDTTDSQIKESLLIFDEAILDIFKRMED